MTPAAAGEKNQQHRQASRRGEQLARKDLAKKLRITMKHIFERKLPGYKDGVVTVKDIINTDTKFNNRHRPAEWPTPSSTQLVRTHINISYCAVGYGDKNFHVTKCTVV